ncbi:hypothetical protein CDL15_Pgr002492 [Punica granatum]|uniref:tRNA synthetases class I catalytic domain-containing protein n=1 Tax=Punica granatum TaxID=22663 RepID=A0A218XU89_PUNGR|nr:hypothetical protein CDL15_Pgr002492 [Punica granatum]
MEGRGVKMEKKNKLAVELREQLRLYNSMTQQKEVLKPLVEGKVGMYVCGITTYDFSHLGYARPPSLSTSSIGPPLFLYLTGKTSVLVLLLHFMDDPEKPGEPIRWESPRGPGRPGWHIECSAMSNHHLSHKFDIHGGESDLSFPHHENEIAQSCAACPEARINYWMHKGLVSVNNQKMSKSDKDAITIRYDKYHPLALRHFLVSAQYRSPLNYSDLQLEVSSDAIYNIYQILKDREDALLSFKQEIESTEQPNDEAQECTSEIEAQVKGILGILGFLVLSVLPLTYERVLEELKKKALRRAELEQADLEKLIRKRALARKNKEFTKSDQIRASLMAKGIELMELGDETDWRPCPPLPPANQAAKSPSENVCSVAVHVQQQPLILP